MKALIDFNHCDEQENDGPILSLSLVHEEILGYIHSDLKDIILFDDDDNNNNNERRLPLSLIMNSGLEDYFEGVLLRRSCAMSVQGEVNLIH